MRKSIKDVVGSVLSQYCSICLDIVWNGTLAEKPTSIRTISPSNGSFGRYCYQELVVGRNIPHLIDPTVLILELFLLLCTLHDLITTSLDVLPNLLFNKFQKFQKTC
jgi:hypothetical protein